MKTSDHLLAEVIEQLLVRCPSERQAASDIVDALTDCMGIETLDQYSRWIGEYLDSLHR